MSISALVLSFLPLCLGSPLPSLSSGNDDNSPVLFGRQTPECMNAGRYRTKQEIILSCFATIFVCTWVAVHPNVPGIWDSRWEKTKRKLAMVIYALVSPEFIVFWALRQWMAAGRIAKEFNDNFNVKDKGLVPKGVGEIIESDVVEFFEGPQWVLPTEWTRTHGFLVQMGGFMLYEGRTPVQVLKFDELVKLIKKGEVDMPDITEDEVSNMSKRDLLTKLVVVLQTSWFSFHCLARWAARLPVTEFEVVTLAFVALNLVTCVLWWGKPQNVLVAVRVQRKRKDTQAADHGGTVAEEETETEGLLRGGEEKKNWLEETLRTVMNMGWLEWLFGVPIMLLFGFVRPLMKMSGDAVVRGMGHTKLRLRVPMFSADTPNQIRDLLPISATGMLFGAIHLISWSSPFPSAAERWLWRSSSLIITIESFTLLLYFFAAYFHDHYHNSLSNSLRRIVALLSMMGAPSYLLARLILAVVAFTTLRTLPQDAYTAVEWTTFIPHL